MSALSFLKIRSLAISALSMLYLPPARTKPTRCRQAVSGFCRTIFDSFALCPASVAPRCAPRKVLLARPSAAPALPLVARCRCRQGSPMSASPIAASANPQQHEAITTTDGHLSTSRLSHMVMVCVRMCAALAGYRAYVTHVQDRDVSRRLCVTVVAAPSPGASL